MVWQVPLMFPSGQTPHLHQVEHLSQVAGLTAAAVTDVTTDYANVTAENSEYCQNYFPVLLVDKTINVDY